MATDDPNTGPSIPEPRPLMPDGISLEAFREGFGEDLCHVLNVENWRSGRNLDEEYRRIDAEVQLAVRLEDELQRQVREEVHPRLAHGALAPPGAGRHEVALDEIEAVQRGLLFNGAVEACDGNSHIHNTLPLTIHQLGVSLVSYKGDRGAWSHRLFRRDLRQRHTDPVREVLAALERRGQRGGLDQPDAHDLLSELAQRAIMSHAERAVLLYHSEAPWRLGHGSPAPLELLSGGGSTDLMIESIKVIREFVLHHQKIVFVASAPNDLVLMTIGGALRPLEYAIVCDLKERLAPALEKVHVHGQPTVDSRWDGELLSPERWLLRFRDEIATKIVVGVYRATLLAPPQLFYAHVDHADVAARIALADSVFQEQRGFPLLIDMADQLCRTVYGGGSLRDMVAAAYAAAGAPFRFNTERATRTRSELMFDPNLLGAPAANDPHTRLQQALEDAQRTHPIVEPHPNAVGVTTFDQPGSEDCTLTVLLAKDKAQQAPAQALVRIDSKPDGRRYLGVVTAGPFAEPDSLRADSPVLVTVATRANGGYLPPYHGRVQVAILGELLADDSLAPPRLRPLPHSPVYRLSDAESAALLKATGDIHLGLAVGHKALEVGVPSTLKAVLPRHTAVLGTTGGGKSTTVAGLIHQAQQAGLAVVLLDVEGEYTFLHQPNDDPRMVAGLRERGRAPAGLPAERMTLYHLAGRDTANPAHPRVRPFTLQFARLSPYAVMEILQLSDAQQERFLKAYDITKEVMRELGIFPAKSNSDQERLALEIDEFERGYPRMTLSLLMDVVGACLTRADRSAGQKAGVRVAEDALEAFRPFNAALANEGGLAVLRKRVHAASPPGHSISWRALLGRLARLNRLKVFFDEAAGTKPLNYRELLRPGNVSVIDLSDTGMSELNNIVIADLLRGLHDTQDDLYQEHERAPGAAPSRALVIVEEAHEFLSEERIEKTSILFQQVARIAKRGRKRWLGLVFVSQLPQHLPRQLLALVNSFILHKITDPGVVGALRKTVSGIDEGLWARLPGLAPGQAIVSFPHMTRPLLVSMAPAPGKLRLVD